MMEIIIIIIMMIIIMMIIIMMIIIMRMIIIIVIRGRMNLAVLLGFIKKAFFQKQLPYISSLIDGVDLKKTNYNGSKNTYDVIADTGIKYNGCYEQNIFQIIEHINQI
jgi:hypothetical protein